MSRTLSPSPTRWAGFPRVSGDEPDVVTFADALGGFSPRERG